MLSKSDNIIRTLHLFILGQAAFEEDYNTKDDKVLGFESPLVESPPLRIPKKSRAQKVQNKPKQNNRRKNLLQTVMNKKLTTFKQQISLLYCF
jgi:hypothetical protein